MSTWTTAVKKKSPYLWWPFDPAGSDLSGNKRPMTLDDFAAIRGQGASVIAGGGADGSTDYPGVTGNTGRQGADIDGVKGWGIWANYRMPGTNTALGMTTGGVHAMLLQLAGGAALNLYYADGAGTQFNVGSDAGVGPGAVPLNQPVFISCDWDGKVVCAYVNGKLVASAPLATRYNPGAAGYLLAPWGIGTTDGRYDELVAFDYAPGAAGWLDLYQAGIGVVPPQVRVRSEVAKLIHNIYPKGGGEPIRVGPDERSLIQKATAYSFETDEHGFGPSDLVVPRPTRDEPFDSAMLGSLITTDQDGRNVYEGRMVGRPRLGVSQVELQFEGWSKHGDDDETASLIGRDMDLQAWKPTSAQRKIDQGATWNIADPEVIPDDSTGAPILQFRNDRTPNVAPWVMLEAWYDAGVANPIRQMVAQGRIIAIFGTADAAWSREALLGDTDRVDGSSAANLRDTTGGVSPLGAGTITMTVNATSLTRRFARLVIWKGAAEGTAGHTFGWTQAAIYCTDLPKRGAEPNAGHYVSDLVPYAVSRWCPAWQMTPDSIEGTSFVVPHSKFTEADVTANKIIEALVLYGGNSFYPLDWFVYDRQTFYLRSPGTYGRTWRFRRDEGAEPDDQGPDAARLVNGVQVTYNPGDGSSLTVGPVGSGSNVETAQLQVLSTNNPWTRAGLRNWKGMDMGITSGPGGLLLGQMFLFDRNRQEWRGSIKAKGSVRDSAGAPHPPYMVRALERGVLEEDPDTRQRRIIGTKYDDKPRETEVSIGTRPDRLDSLLTAAGATVSDIGGS